MDRNIPANRQLKPTAMTGSTWRSCGKMPREVRLPSMLKSMSCPKTHTPPITVSTSWRTCRSATAAKQVPVTMTSSSGWKREPGLKPIGTSSSPASPAPMPKAQSATARTRRKLSTGAPVKTWCPLNVSFVRRGMIQPLVAPRRAPANRVAMKRMTLAIATSEKSMSGWLAGAERPTRVPKSVSAKDASNGAQMKTSRGMGCPGKCTPNSFIFGMTRPSPIATSTVPSTRPSTTVNPMTKCPYTAIASSSHVAGKRAIMKM
mmetsp:Transcript_50665/g.140544  ORF Transcript_50665/g.140544 Transcript_50665/m.140544 type:complete len:261 (-) Transcript_50665:330-1112(-)